MSKTQKVAVIGLGNIGRVVATNLAKSNRSFVVASRNSEKTRELSQALGKSAQPANIETALSEANIIVLAIPFPAIAEFFNRYSSVLAGKIIIDPSNPISPDEKGGFKKIVGQNESAGEINAAAIPAGAKLVKAIGTLGADSLRSASFQEPERTVLFYASDDTSINSEIEQLIKDIGFEPMRIGGLDQSIRIEVFGDLHEFGALGKTVKNSEAKSKLYQGVF